MRLTLVLLSLALCYGQETNPFQADPNAAEIGRVMFRIYCAPCHGIHAQGGRGPDLTLGAYSAGDRDQDLFRVVSNGIPGSEMPGYGTRIDREAIWRLVSYVRSVGRHENVTVDGDVTAGEKLFWGKGSCG